MGLGLDTNRSMVKSFLFEDVCDQYAALVRGAGGDGYTQLPAAANAADFVGFSQYEVTDKRLAQPVIVESGMVLVRAASAFDALSLLRIADTDGRVEAVVKIDRVQSEQLTIAANAATLAKKAAALIHAYPAVSTGQVGPFKQFANTAVAAHEMTLGFKADALLSVTITAGGVTGRCNVLPAGVAPASSKDVALNALRTKVLFLAADAVTAATIDVLRPDFSRVEPLKIQLAGEAPAVGEIALNAGKTAIAVNATDAITTLNASYLIEDPEQYVVALALEAAGAEGDLVPAVIVRGHVSGLK